VVVGDGPLRSYYQKRVPDDMQADVHWAGRVDWERPRYYTSADVHCTPCNRASFGMVLLEAMSCGRPIVASRISGFQLLMEHGKHGLMIHPADDATRFAEALLYQLDRPAERARMGREGRRTAVTQYAWPKVAAQLEDYYLELMRGRR
jgi:phosphatidylinositol alpha-mannosyltransferase